METVEGLHHVALRCNDLEGCERFYADVLGLPVLKRWPGEGGGDRSVWMSLGRGFLALERATRPVEDAPFEDAPAGWQVVALAIRPSERAAWKERLSTRGVSLERESPWTLFLRDPEGNRVALSHWPEEA